VRSALDGPTALALVEQREPQLILMDLRLPGWMDGIVLTEMLKRDARRHHIPILALTAYSWLETEEMARNAGCDGYIPMPINAETLVQVVAQHLQPAQSANIPLIS
jgi:CheY-like chemotaxis protein